LILPALKQSNNNISNPAKATTAKTMLSFVNEKTQKKFLITNDLDKVCTELGWNKREVEECGGVTDFMNKHEKAGTSMIFDDE